MPLDGQVLSAILVRGVPICQCWADNVLEMVNPFPRILNGSGNQLGVGMPGLLVLLLRYSQSRDTALASGALEAP